MSRKRRSRIETTLGPSAHAPLSSLTSLLRPVTSLPRPHLSPVEDRRTFHPLNDTRPARTIHGTPAGRPVVSPPKPNRALRLAHTLKFPDPKRVAICVRRNQRKEVLHALKKTGRGKGGGKKHFNWYSKIGC